MNSQQFEEIYRENYPALRKAARHLIGDSDAAHDVVQDVFLRLWNKRDESDAILNPAAYLYKSVVNTSLNYIEQHKRRKPGAEPLSLPSLDKSDSLVETKELRSKIGEAIDKLPPQCRTIFILSRLEEKKNREIAALMNLSLKTVENQMGIALKKMRDELKPYLNRDIFAITILFAIHLLYSGVGPGC